MVTSTRPAPGPDPEKPRAPRTRKGGRASVRSALPAPSPYGWATAGRRYGSAGRCRYSVGRFGFGRQTTRALVCCTSW